MNVPLKDLETLKRLGDQHLAAERYQDATDAYEAAATMTELPRGGLRVKLARAHIEAGRPDRASDWLMGLVDPAPSFKTWMSGARLLDRCPVDSWPAVRKVMRVGLVSTWMTGTFAPLLRLACARHGIALDVYEPPFGQYFNASLDPSSGLYAGQLDAVFLCPDYRALGVKAHTDTPDADVAAEVERWSSVWRGLRRASSPIIVQLGFAHPGGDPLGHLASGLDGSRRRVVARINADLARLAVEEDVGFVDVGLLAGQLGSDAWFDERGWYVAKIAYGAAAMPVLARHTAAVLAARLGLSRRCLVLDLDNTLWGGVVGDDGVDGIALGNGPDGEAFVEFQHALKDLVAARHPAGGRFQERSGDRAQAVSRASGLGAEARRFRGLRRQLGAKSANIRAIAETLSLGLDAFTFLDDNPYERSEVRRVLPEVDVPIMPEEPSEYRSFLDSYVNFEPASFTDNDRARAEQYRARAKAEAIRVESRSLEEYPGEPRHGGADRDDRCDLDQPSRAADQQDQPVQRHDAAAQPCRTRGIPRAAGRRRAVGAADRPVCRPRADRRRAGGARRRRHSTIDSFLMSCRVLGRGVENALMGELARRAEGLGCARIEGRYIPSGRNGMVADLFARLGLTEATEMTDGTLISTGNAAAIPAGPDSIVVERD